MVEDEDLALLYSGYRKMQLLHYNYAYGTTKGWTVYTSGGQGVCSTTAFGKEQTEENFIQDIRMTCQVYFPDVEEKVLINLTMDTKETEGWNRDDHTDTEESYINTT